MARSRSQARLGVLLRRRARRVSRGPSGRPWLPAADVGRVGRAVSHDVRRVRHARSTRRTPRSTRCARRWAASRTSRSSTRGWLNALKLHAATLPLAEFAAVIGNLRAARFGRDSAWRTTAHARRARRAPPHADPARADARARALRRAVRLDAQVLSLEQLGRDRGAPPGRRAAARRRTPIEFAIAHQLRVRDRLHQPAVRRPRRRWRTSVGDRMFEKMVEQHPERRGAPRADRRAGAAPRSSSTTARYAQYLLDKWFWRSWLLFAVVTGFSMDYLTPLEQPHAVVQGVHGGVGARPVPALARGATA